MEQIIQANINTTTREELEEIAGTLLEQKLIACVDFFPVESEYWWQGKIDREKRWHAFSYTTESKTEEIIKAVEKMHSDDIPGVIFLPVQTNRKYSEWLIGELNHD